MTDNTQPEALRLANEFDAEFAQWRISKHTGRKAAAELRRQHARIAELEAQLESIGAGAGSEPVAWLVCTDEGDPDMVFLSQHEAQQYLEDDERPTPLYTHPSPQEGIVGGWISVDERLPDLYKRVLVITTDADDEPYATPAHYNGPGKFLAAGGHRLNPVTHWQEIDAPPVGWKLPPAKPRVSNRRKPSSPTTPAGSGKVE